MTFAKYLFTYIALLLLSGLTFTLSFANLGRFEWIVALGIATLKACLVAWFFMHLVEMSATHRLAGVVASVLLAVFIFFAIADVQTRPQSIEPEPPTLAQQRGN